MRALANIPFLLGEGTEISVSAYPLVLERKISAPVKVDRKNNEVVERTAYFTKIPETKNPFAALHNNGEAEEPEDVPEGDRLTLAQGKLNRKTELGGKEITLTGSEWESLRRVEKPAIWLVGFKPMSCLKESHRMGSS
jgi:hypothetical protein